MRVVDVAFADDVVEDGVAIGGAEAVTGRAILVIVETGDGASVETVDASKEAFLTSDAVTDADLGDVTADLDGDASETNIADGVVFTVPGCSDPEPSFSVYVLISDAVNDPVTVFGDGVVCNVVFSAPDSVVSSLASVVGSTVTVTEPVSAGAADDGGLVV